MDRAKRGGFKDLMARGRNYAGEVIVVSLDLPVRFEMRVAATMML